MEQKIVDISAQTQRQAWMKVLSTCKSASLKMHWNKLESHIPDFEIIRQPERGLVMVQGHAGSQGRHFNIGEMTVSRSAVRLKSGETGVSYVSGRDRDHALIAAKADALLQSTDHKDLIQEQLIAPLNQESEQQKSESRAKTAATKVNFFTMVRQREDKK